MGYFEKTDCAQFLAKLQIPLSLYDPNSDRASRASEPQSSNQNIKLFFYLFNFQHQLHKLVCTPRMLDQEYILTIQVLLYFTFLIIFFYLNKSKSLLYLGIIYFLKLKLSCDRRPFGQCVSVSGSHLELMTRCFFSV
jgi:hypothetical protein